MLLRSPHFPTGQAYFDMCPDSISHFEWLFHPGNLYRFEQWVRDLLKDIKELSYLLGWSFIRQAKLPARYDVDVRWLREILDRLVSIGVVETRRSRQRLYWLSEDFLARATSDHSSDQATDRTTDHTSDLKLTRPARKPRSKKTSRPVPSHEHDHSSSISGDSKDREEQAGARPDLLIEQERDSDHPLGNKVLPASSQPVATPAPELNPQPAMGKDNTTLLQNTEATIPAPGSRHALDVCIAFARFEQTINPKIIDPSRMGAARWRDGRDDYLIDAWLAGQYQPMEADCRRRKPSPATGQAKRDLLVGGQWSATGDKWSVVSNKADVDSQTTNKIELDLEVINYQQDLEARRAAAFDALQDADRAVMIEEKIYQLKHSARGPQFRRMPEVELITRAIHEIQKDLISS